MAPLDYLDFDYGEDEEGHGSFDAMAAAGPAHLAALRAEVARVLDWACLAFGPPRPLEEGGEWDCALQGVREVATTLEVRHAPGTLELADAGTAPPRTTLSLTLSGTPAFCDALRREFSIEA
jgi:hypothetical protein